MRSAPSPRVCARQTAALPTPTLSTRPSKAGRSRRGSLYPAQDEALIEVVSGANVVVSTPTGSGKSLIAVGAHFAALAAGRRSYYTAPIKALVSEKFFALGDLFGPSERRDDDRRRHRQPDRADHLRTAEILANQALRAGADAADVGVVMDEFHYYADPQRGWAWQVPLLELRRAQFVLMTATLGDTAGSRPTCPAHRPPDRGDHVRRAPGAADLPLSLSPLHETIEELLASGQAPIYVVHFTQAAAIERAQALMRA